MSRSKTAATAAAAADAHPQSQPSSPAEPKPTARAARPATLASTLGSLAAAAVPIALTYAACAYLQSRASLPGLVSTFLLILLLNLAGWIHACVWRTEKCYDLLGTGSYVAAMLFTITRSSVWMDMESDLWLEQLLLSSMVALWAFRLGSHLVARVWRSGEDRRFRAVKTQPVRYLVFWMGQVVWVTIVGLPVWMINLQSPAAASASAAASVLRPAIDPLTFGLSLFTVGFLLESRADREKSDFKSAQHSPSPPATAWIETGMWSLSRHPNYLGEIMLWSGVSCVAGGALIEPCIGTVIACVASPLILTLLLTQVSGIPLLEAHADKSWGNNPAYLAYKSRTGVLLPKAMERAWSFLVRWVVAACALFSAYLCGRMFTYIAHSLKVLPTEANAWPHYFTRPLPFDLMEMAGISSASHPLLAVVVNSLWNFLLVIQFGICHVGFARPVVYKLCGVRFHRALFMMVTCASYHVIMMLWRHNSGLIAWDALPLIQGALALVGISVTHAQLLDVFVPLWGLIFIILCCSTVFKLDVWYFIGVRQPFMNAEEVEKEEQELLREMEAKRLFYAAAKNNKHQHNGDTSAAPSPSPSPSPDSAAAPVHVQKKLMVTGMYRWVRHPMYFWLQTLCVCSPYMTYDRLCYFVFTTALLSVGLTFEENKLIREFGEEYRQYQKRTPMLFPTRWPAPEAASQKVPASGKKSQ